MLTRLGFFCISIVMMAATGCAKSPIPPKTAKGLDVARYMGVWHEIARLPFPFEDDCFGASAEYELITDEEFLITNYCWYKSFFGPMRRAQADAWIEDEADKSKFKVSFFWPFALDYWVLYVDEDYQTALVGTPDRKYLWIMSRKLQMDDATYKHLLARAESDGFDVFPMIKTPQRNIAKAPSPLEMPPDEDTSDAGRPTDTDEAPVTETEPVEVAGE